MTVKASGEGDCVACGRASMRSRATRSSPPEVAIQNTPAAMSSAMPVRIPLVRIIGADYTCRPLMAARVSRSASRRRIVSRLS
jgi:hypothetical protein